MLGYVMYDVTHYYLHHAQPTRPVTKNLKVKQCQVSKPGTFFSFVSGLHKESLFVMFFLMILQKYHLNHHFRIQDKGFGITSSLWDIVFGTLPTTKAPRKEQ